MDIIERIEEIQGDECFPRIRTAIINGRDIGSFELSEEAFIASDSYPVPERIPLIPVLSDSEDYERFFGEPDRYRGINSIPDIDADAPDIQTTRSLFRDELQSTITEASEAMANYTSFISGNFNAEGTISFRDVDGDSIIDNQIGSLFVNDTHILSATIAAAPLTIPSYVQLTREDYDSLLNRISLFEERLTALEERRL